MAKRASRSLTIHLFRCRVSCCCPQRAGRDHRPRATRKAIPVFLAADPAPTSGGSSFMTIGFFVLIVGAMYFLMIRPQNKRRREAQEMQSKLGPGDEVQTVGG